MPEYDAAAICRRLSDMTAMRASLMRRVSVAFPLISDIAQANAVCYARASKPGSLVVLSSEKPCTAMLPDTGRTPGELLSKVEEPLVVKTFETGHSMKGKCEWAGDSDVDMWTMPICDNNDVVAVLVLETIHGRQVGYEYVIKMCKLLIDSARRGSNAEAFEHMDTGDGVIIADKTERIQYANASAIGTCRMIGIGSLVGRHIFDRQFTSHLEQETLSPDKPWAKEQVMCGRTLVVRNLCLRGGGNVLGTLRIISDVTELRQKEREIRVQSVVIREIHHRVKNNLQTIASLLRMQARRASTNETKLALRESISRIMSISMVHAFLSKRTDEDIDVQKLIQEVTGMISESMLPAEFKFVFRINGPDVVLPVSQANNFGLVVNEIVTNAIEHGFSGKDHGSLIVTTSKHEKYCRMDFYNDGNGLPDGFKSGGNRTLGLRIISMLVEDEMHGTFAIEQHDGEPGVHAIINLRIQADE